MNESTYNENRGGKSRKELKEEYKKRKPQMGVFQIRNINSNRVFIDNGIDMTAKINRHKAELKMGTHQNKSLLKDWTDLGEDSFVFEVLSELKESDNEGADYRKELKLMQQLVLEEMDSVNLY